MGLHGVRCCHILFSLVIAVASFFMDVSSKGCPGVHKTPGHFLFGNFFVAWVALWHKCATLSTSTQKFFTVMIPINKSAYLTVRVADKTRTKFHAKARKFGTPSEVLRELVDAFIEDRVTINPPVTGNPKEKLYEPRIQN
jgi:hypothetical protein